MAIVDFHKGLRANLPTNGIDDGSLYITEDTGELFKSVGVNTPLLKIGDILTGYANLADLQAKNPAIQKKLYFTDDNNIYKYTGSAYVLVDYRVTIVDTLTSTSTTDALSGNMGRVLNNTITEHLVDYTSTPVTHQLELPSGFTKGSIEYRKGANNLVEVRVNLSKLDAFTPAVTSIGTLPVGFRPSRVVAHSGFNILSDIGDYTGVVGDLSIAPNGVILVGAMTSNSNAKQLFGLTILFYAEEVTV